MKYVYFFGVGKSEGKAEMKNLLGGKGANLAEMSNLGLPVPAGFTVTTEVCTHYYQNNDTYPEELDAQIWDSVKKVEAEMGGEFGSSTNPLLLSVRSGARVSMPGMMDTVLNLGLNDTTVEGLAKMADDRRFAFDSYRRFVQMYAGVVLGLDSKPFEHLLTEARNRRGLKSDSELTEDELAELTQKFKQIVEKETGKVFPSDPKAQLYGAIGAVFGSWMGARAISYRRINRIPEDWGTAVNVQAMAFGNMGNDCATGVAFTRNPSTGEAIFFGEYLQNAQGEDVVAGIRTPAPINQASATGEKMQTLEELFPINYGELVDVYKKLEQHYKDMQDIEFTVQKGKLFMLQTRGGKRTAKASVKIAVDMVREGLIDQNEAIRRVQPEQIEQLLHPSLDPKAPKKQLAKGLPASPGAACGEVVLTSEEAEQLKKEGKKAILVRHETSPEDIGGMDAAEGILTALGGMTSHAAVVARGMGKPCVAGCGAINIDIKKQLFTVGDVTVKKGDPITLDGASGQVFLGEVPTLAGEVDADFEELMTWVDERRRMRVRTNADTPHDAKVGRQFGAEGIGLCRTEHMFFEEDRITAVREMIVADTLEQREAALEKIFPMQKQDFIGIFREMKGYPVTIRLLDPPLHEFLPHSDAEITELAKTLNVSADVLKNKIKKLHEFNPMLGHRGCRLAISYPEVCRMQARAIIEAACELVSKEDFEMVPEIMVPLVGSVEEFKILKDEIVAVADKTIEKYNVKMEYLVGTMIEVPRAALVSDKIAEEAQFFSFGTNDLTQMALGLSRDDAGTFLPSYVEKGIYSTDPFVTLDQAGVGRLLKISVEGGRGTNGKLKIGICGEHGGDPKTVVFCHKLGLDYVSCSPFRVPVARLAAAQANLE